MAASARMLAVAASALGALILGGVLAGCTPSAPKPTHSAPASHTPMFASDAEALKAATDAYAAYLKMSDTIAHDGGKNPERIKPYVTAAWAAKEIAGFGKLQSSHLRQVGSSKYDSARLQRTTDSAVSIYVCSDVSDTRFLDAKGQDATPADRRNYLALTASFVPSQAAPASGLILEDYEPWAGKDFCSH